ncbi:ornithine aminotransferase, partial [Coelomomyces lativittatus]
YFHYDQVLPMNTGAEAVETGLKLARKWGYLKKKIPMNEAWIVGMTGNFHGRTLGVISMSTDALTRNEFGPYLPNVGPTVGSWTVQFNEVESLEQVLQVHHANIAAILLEPIQGEAGVQVPDEGYVATVAMLAKKYHCLWIADEIQTGLGRTGQLLACDWDHVRPDILLLGKALGGGVVPVSAVLANKEIMECIQPGEHGSTFGGNPLACAVAMTSLQVIKEEKLMENAARLGPLFRSELKKIVSPYIKAIRGRGLLNAIEIHPNSTISAWQICHLLIHHGLLAKPTHDTVIRLAPPLCITEEEILKGARIIQRVFESIDTVDLSTIPRLTW